MYTDQDRTTIPIAQRIQRQKNRERHQHREPKPDPPTGLSHKKKKKGGKIAERRKLGQNKESRKTTNPAEKTA